MTKKNKKHQHPNWEFSKNFWQNLVDKLFDDPACHIQVDQYCCSTELVWPLCIKMPSRSHTTAVLKHLCYFIFYQISMLALDLGRELIGNTAEAD